MVGKFLFFENDSITPMSLGRVCVATRKKSFISDVVQVNIHGEDYDVYVQELGSWSINLQDASPQETKTNSTAGSESDNDKEADSESDEKEDIQEVLHDTQEGKDVTKDQDESIHSNNENVVHEEEIPEIKRSDWTNLVHQT